MRPDFLKTGIIIRGIVLGILFLPNLLWADTDIGKTVVKQLNPAFTIGSSRSDTNPTPIPWSELGAQVSMQSQGRGTSIQASKSGACLESMFQRLAGEVGEHGLQLWSTVKDDPQTRFSVLATGLGRRKGNVAALERSGRVEVEKNLVRFLRSGVVEEYTVSVDGVRQDFVIAEPPPGKGDLRVELSVAGATARPSDRGATLILQDSRRQLSYYRLRVVDARNRQLPARLVVELPQTLAVVVADANAVYPIRIDPTFSDADWHGMDFTSGTEEQIHAVAVMGGDVYVGGSFTEANGAPGDHIARWNGSTWSPVGYYGANDTVINLLVDGSDLYVCGWFTEVGEGTIANHIAKYVPASNTWYALGSDPNWGTDGLVNAMAMDGGGNLYIGGNFTTAGGVAANSVAKLSGSTWSALGSGMGGDYPIVDALVMDGSDLYAGGWFTTAGGVTANRVAKWSEGSWSALGAGMDWVVKVLAVDPGHNLYAGGLFSSIGGVPFNRIAKWEGGAWNHLGTGVNSASGQGVYALAIDDVGNLYVGGEFTAAGGVSASNIAIWYGSSWTTLGSGTDGLVSAITPSGDSLYVGGMFTQAGGNSAFHVAYADNLPVAPTVTTAAVTSITTNSAAGGGNVTSQGSTTLTARGVCWSTSPNPTTGNSHTTDGTTTGTFTSAITGLTPNTTYHVRAYATNNNNMTSYGDDLSFTTTTAVVAPTVTTTAVSSVTTNSATSGGNVTYDGGAALTAKGVCWSTSANPTISDGHTSDGTDTGTYTSAITSLTPNTTYHVRAYATNNNNMTGYGDDLSFTTAAAVPGGTYYVNISTGSDSNNGSAANPWKTLHYAIDQINGGSAGTYTLIVAPGGASTWYRISNGEANAELTISQSNVTVVAQSGSTVIIDGTGAASWPDGIKITGSNVILRNLYITGFTGTDPEGTGVEIVAGSNNTVENCRVYGNFHGIIVQACNPEISRNSIYDNRFNISLQADSGETTSPTIKNNLIYQVTSGEVHFGILMGGAGTANPKIYHNTIDGGLYDGIYMDGVGNAPEIKYNIITGFGQFGVENFDSVGNPIVDYNDAWNNDSGQYDGCVSPPPGANNISADPQFASYKLASTSPCINTIPSSEDPVTLDYPGFIRPRPGKATKDMGAYEYVVDETVDYTLPGGTGLATDYRIFSIPLNLGTGADMLGAMEDVLGSYDPVHWRAFLYNGTTYNEFNSSQFASHTIKPGMGYWIITTYTDVIPFKGQPAPDGVNYVMELDPGWHLIGLPWLDTNIFLSSIKVTDGVNSYALSSPNNDLTQKFLWDYTGVDGYVQRSAAGFRLQNNKGYYFKVLGNAPIRMIIPNAANAPQSAPVEMNPNGVNTHDDEEPPPPPGAEPIPDIKANGQDGQITVNEGDSVTVSVGLDPGVWSGRNADWWIAAHTPFDPPLDWYTYVYPEGWKPGIHVGVQIPLFEFSGPFSVLKMSFPAGSYTFYFAVDGNMDGKPDVTWMDSVPVKVE
jgi:parallel beta-helix repeat protein